MHELLKLVILKPAKIRANLAANKSTLAKQMIALTRLDPYTLFLTVINSYFHHVVGAAIADTQIIPRSLVDGFESVDDLYYQIAETYKEATGMVPPVRQDYVVVGPLKVNCPENTKPLVVLNSSQFRNHSLVIDPKELAVSVYFIPDASCSGKQPS